MGTDAPARPWAKYALGAGALVALALAAWWFLGGGKPPTISPDAARPIAETFLADVRTGTVARVDAAWDGTSAEFKSNQGREQFRKFVRGNKALASATTFQDCQMSEANGVRVARCSFRTASGAPLTVLLAHEGGAWKVERLLLE